MRYVYYIEVGSLPKAKAETHLREQRQFLLDQGVFDKSELIVLGTRHGQTRIEALP